MTTVIKTDRLAPEEPTKRLRECPRCALRGITRESWFNTWERSNDSVHDERTTGQPANPPATPQVNPPVNPPATLPATKGFGDSFVLIPSGSDPDPNPSSPENPKRGRARNKNRAEETKAFQDFYVAFPRKEKRKRAWRTWLREKLEPRADEIMEGLRRWLPDFAARPADAVPHPATFLYDEQYLDSPPVRKPRFEQPAVRAEREREERLDADRFERLFGAGR